MNCAAAVAQSAAVSQHVFTVRGVNAAWRFAVDAPAAWRTLRVVADHHLRDLGKFSERGAFRLLRSASLPLWEPWLLTCTQLESLSIGGSVRSSPDDSPSMSLQGFTRWAL
jgi:hypothetical protein